jgi:hypothetical protein
MDVRPFGILSVSIAFHSTPSSLFSPSWLFLGLPLIGASLAWQGWQLHGLLQPTHGVVAASAPAARLSVPPRPQTLALFGSPARAPLRTASLDLRLQACFLRQPAEQSSALIARPGQPARRLQVGALIQPGVRLLSIQARQVELDVNGQRQRLGLYRKPATPAPSTANHL